MKWIWCEVCNCAAVVCPECGNNCCNGGSGENCTDKCNEGYKYQDEAYKNGTNPKTPEECEGVIEDPFKKRRECGEDTGPEKEDGGG